MVVSTIALAMTIGVYTLVAGIVKLDDAGVYLIKEGTGAQQKIGESIVKFAPILMKTLSAAGTVAMFLVGGGILVHGIPMAHHLLENLTVTLENLPAIRLIAPTLFNGIAGIIAGGIVFLGIFSASKVKARVSRTE